MRRSITVITMTNLLLATAIATAGPASATQHHADHVASMVSAARPASAVRAPVTARDGLLTPAGDITIPNKGNGDVTLVADEGDVDFLPHDVTVALPIEAAVAQSGAVVAEDGTVVYDGAESVDVAVQILEDGVRIATVLGDRTAPRTYTYTLSNGVVPVINEDGSVELTVKDGLATYGLGVIEAPWAVDARGQSVATHFEVRGSSVIQHIRTTPSTSYPVVADPDLLERASDTTSGSTTPRRR